MVTSSTVIYSLESSHTVKPVIVFIYRIVLSDGSEETKFEVLSMAETAIIQRPWPEQRSQEKLVQAYTLPCAKMNDVARKSDVGPDLRL